MIKKLVHSIQDLYRIVNDKAPERIIKELEIERLAVIEYLRQHDPYETAYCSIQESQCTSCGLLVWEKDDKHRYTAVNARHLNVFYDLPISKKNQIIGKTDEELITTWRDQTGCENTFGEMCVSTDDYVKLAGEPCRFFEFGYKLGKPLLLDVFKRPIVLDGNFIGTHGNALDISDRESDVVDLLQFYMSIEIAVRIDGGCGGAVAAYLIKDRKKQFDREFPG